MKFDGLKLYLDRDSQGDKRGIVVLKHKHTIGHCSSYLFIACYTQYILIHQHTETRRCTVGCIGGPMCIVSLRNSFFFF